MAKKEKKDGTKETITLMRWLISQIDGEAYRRGTLSGERHPMVDQKLIRLLGGQKNLLSQARELERDIVLGQSGKIRFEWRDMNMDIKNTIDKVTAIMPQVVYSIVGVVLIFFVVVVLVPVIQVYMGGFMFESM